MSRVETERPARNAGFTLVELLVALMVFSLAALALLRLEGATLASTGTLRDRALGQIVARNIAVEALSDPVPLAFGQSEGEAVNAGRTWRWSRAVSAAPDLGLTQIAISVTDAAGEPAGSLTVYRLPR